MAEKYNSLRVPLLVQEGEETGIKPVASLQPGYGPWNSLEEARAGLIDAFGSLTAIPLAYTFCVIENDKPREYWFKAAGVWDVIPKCERSGSSDSDTGGTPTYGTTYNITFGNFIPANAVASVRYGNVTLTVGANETCAVPANVDVDIEVSCTGYIPQTRQLRPITSDFNVGDVELLPKSSETEDPVITIGMVTPEGLSNLVIRYMANGKDRVIKQGESFTVPFASTVSIQAVADDNYRFSYYFVAGMSQTIPIEMKKYSIEEWPLSVYPKLTDGSDVTDATIVVTYLDVNKSLIKRIVSAGEVVYIANGTHVSIDVTKEGYNDVHTETSMIEPRSIPVVLNLTDSSQTNTYSVTVFVFKARTTERLQNAIVKIQASGTETTVSEGTPQGGYKDGTVVGILIRCNGYKDAAPSGTIHGSDLTFNVDLEEAASSLSEDDYAIIVSATGLDTLSDAERAAVRFPVTYIENGVTKDAGTVAIGERKVLPQDVMVTIVARDAVTGYYVYPESQTLLTSRHNNNASFTFAKSSLTGKLFASVSPEECQADTDIIIYDTINGVETTLATTKHGIPAEVPYGTYMARAQMVGYKSYPSSTSFTAGNKPVQRDFSMRPISCTLAVSRIVNNEEGRGDYRDVNFTNVDLKVSYEGYSGAIAFTTPVSVPYGAVVTIQGTGIHATSGNDFTFFWSGKILSEGDNEVRLTATEVPAVATTAKLTVSASSIEANAASFTVSWNDESVQVANGSTIDIPIGATYTIEGKLRGYDSTPVTDTMGSEDDTVNVVFTKKPDVMRTLTFNVTDENGDVIDDATVTVEYNTTTGEDTTKETKTSNESFSIPDGAFIMWSVSKSGYFSDANSLILQGDTEIPVTLTENEDTVYSLTVHINKQGAGDFICAVHYTAVVIDDDTHQPVQRETTRVVGDGAVINNIVAGSMVSVTGNGKLYDTVTEAFPMDEDKEITVNAIRTVYPLTVNVYEAGTTPQYSTSINSSAIVTVQYTGINPITIEGGKSVNIPSGVEVTVVATAEGYHRESVTFTMLEPRTEKVELSLNKGLTVNVYDDNNRDMVIGDARIYILYGHILGTTGSGEPIWSNEGLGGIEPKPGEQANVPAGYDCEITVSKEGYTTFTKVIRNIQSVQTETVILVPDEEFKYNYNLKPAKLTYSAAGSHDIVKLASGDTVVYNYRINGGVEQTVTKTGNASFGVTQRVAGTIIEGTATLTSSDGHTYGIVPFKTDSYGLDKNVSETLYFYPTDVYGVILKEVYADGQWVGFPDSTIVDYVMVSPDGNNWGFLDRESNSVGSEDYLRGTHAAWDSDTGTVITNPQPKVGNPVLYFYNTVETLYVKAKLADENAQEITGTITVDDNTYDIGIQVDENSINSVSVCILTVNTYPDRSNTTILPDTSAHGDGYETKPMAVGETPMHYGYALTPPSIGDNDEQGPASTAVVTTTFAASIPNNAKVVRVDMTVPYSLKLSIYKEKDPTVFSKRYGGYLEMQYNSLANAWEPVFPDEGQGE